MLRGMLERFAARHEGVATKGSSFLRFLFGGARAVDHEHLSQLAGVTAKKLDRSLTEARFSGLLSSLAPRLYLLLKPSGRH